MKLRLLLMGGIISALGAILLIVRGFSAAPIGVLAVGIMVFVVGLLWK
jgi:hypothetical protein